MSPFGFNFSLYSDELGPVSFYDRPKIPSRRRNCKQVVTSALLYDLFARRAGDIGLINNPDNTCSQICNVISTQRIVHRLCYNLPIPNRRSSDRIVLQRLFSH